MLNKHGSKSELLRSLACNLTGKTKGKKASASQARLHKERRLGTKKVKAKRDQFRQKFKQLQLISKSYEYQIANELQRATVVEDQRREQPVLPSMDNFQEGWGKEVPAQQRTIFRSFCMGGYFGEEHLQSDRLQSYYTLLSAQYSTIRIPMQKISETIEEGIPFDQSDYEHAVPSQPKRSVAVSYRPPSIGRIRTLKERLFAEEDKLKVLPQLPVIPEVALSVRARPHAIYRQKQRVLNLETADKDLMSVLSSRRNLHWQLNPQQAKRHAKHASM